MHEPITIGVDIGGTKVLAGAVDACGRVLDQVLVAVPPRTGTPEAADEVIVAVVEDLRVRTDAAAVGIGAAGFIDAAGEHVVFAPHLPWQRRPVRALLQERLGLPVVLENDAHAAAWGELCFGAARESSSALLVALGTGIGGALIVDHALVRGSSGMAGEFGHMRVVPDGLPCECGLRGCWEQYASGNALLRLARARLTTTGPMAQLCDGDPARLTGPAVTLAARQGDPTALTAYAELGRSVGLGLAGLFAAFDPDRVVLGGGLSEAVDLFLETARDTVAEFLVGAAYRSLPTLVAAELGAAAGIIGAADLARRAL